MKKLLFALLAVFTLSMVACTAETEVKKDDSTEVATDGEKKDCEKDCKKKCDKEDKEACKKSCEKKCDGEAKAACDKECSDSLKCNKSCKGDATEGAVEGEQAKACEPGCEKECCKA